MREDAHEGFSAGGDNYEQKSHHEGFYTGGDNYEQKYCLIDFSAGGDPFSSPPENTIYIQTVNVTKYKGWVEVKLYM